LSLHVPAPVASSKGTVDGFDATGMMPDLAGGPLPGELKIAAEVVVQRMPANDLQRFWPPTLGVNARNWITANIHDGAVDEARLSTRFRLGPGSAPPALDAFGGSLKMHGLTVDYKRKMPPMRNV